jgi:hypothetical protein
MNFRFIHDDNGTLKDYSTELADYTSTSTAVIPLVAADDALYFGSFFPFNSIYIKMKTLNIIASTLSLQYWCGRGRGWISAVEKKDESSGLTTSGRITFVPNKNDGWVGEDTVNSSGVEQITDLGGVTIYDRYWLKATYSASLTVGTEIEWIGQIFCSDSDLYSEFPLFNSSNLMTAYATGKTTWEEQRVRASELLIEKLISQRIILSGNQLLDWRTYKTACVAKTASIIFSGLGQDYKEEENKAEAKFNERMEKVVYNVDSNNDGRLESKETRTTQGFLFR